MPVTLLLRFQAASDSGFAPASHGIARNIASSSTPSRQATAPSRILPRSRPTPKPIAADSYTTGASAPPRPVSYPPNRHPPPQTPPKTKTPSTIPPLGPNSRGVFRSYFSLSANYRIILGLALAAYAFGGMYIQDWFFPPTRDEHVESPMSVRVIDKPRPQPS